jgi:ABC-type multidrug transport system permease subunit
MVMAPMIFFGRTYDPWAALGGSPILKRAVLISPRVYASEGFRSALVPQSPNPPKLAIVVALAAFNAAFLALGIRQFKRKATS